MKMCSSRNKKKIELTTEDCSWWDLHFTSQFELFSLFLQIAWQSSVFNGFIMVVIVMNSFVIGFETVEEWKVPHKNVFKALDELFLAIYTMEFLMKLYAEPRGYWKSSYNRFDFSILALSYVQVIMDELNVGDKILTPLRLLRGLW